MVVSASPEGILVSDKEQSSYIKPYVDKIDQQIMFAEKSWGSFRVLDVEDESLTIKVTLNPGHSMNYHSHARRDEVWTVISGRGYAIVDGAKTTVQAGDVVKMPAGSRHTIVADTELKVMEVQLGRDISVHDKEKVPVPGSVTVKLGQNRKFCRGALDLCRKNQYNNLVALVCWYGSVGRAADS